MKSIYQKNILAASMTVMFATLFFTTSAFAASYMKFCSQWTRTYVDSGYGEDYFTSPSTNVQSAAAFSRYEVRVGSVTATPIQSGFLDGVGCMSSSITIQPNTTYYFTQGTWTNVNTRRVYVNTDTGDTFNDTINWLTSSYITASSLINNFTYTHSFTPVWASPKANLMPIAATIVGNYSTLAIPENNLTRFRTDIDACESDGAYYVYGTGNICVVANGDIYSWGDMTTWKFTVAHEFGHRVAYANGGPLTNAYSDNPTESLCKCDHIGSYGDPAHCLQSREYASAAQSEGFGHFFATAVMNARTENNGQFVYPKPALALEPDWITYGPPSPIRAYIGTTEVYSDRWMEKYCNPGDTANGVELDWLRFYYETWTSGTSKFSVQEIIDVWDDATDPNLGWDNTGGSVLPTVKTQWGTGSNKAVLFENKGIQAGVDHG